MKMKKLAKIFSLILIMMGSVIGFNACGGDPYEDLKITLSETSISLAYDTQDDENNIFELSATVSGGDDDVSRNVIFQSSNENIVSLIEGSQKKDGDKTTAKFILVGGGNAKITVRSEEKASIYSTCDVSAEVAVSKLEFYGNTLETQIQLPIEYGVKTDISGKFGTNIAGRIKFTPEKTTQRNIILKAYTIDGVLLDEDAVKIEENYITVLSQAIDEFKLYAESAHNSELHDEIVVKVLKPITHETLTASAIGADDVANEATSLKSSVLGAVKTFELNLANNVVVGGYENRKNVVLNIDDMDLSELEELYTFTLQKEKPINFSVRSLEAINTFLFEQGDGNATEEVSIYINYKGFEKYFQNSEVKIKVNVSAFADNVLITKLNETESRESYDVYKNYSNNQSAYAMYGVDYKGLALNVKSQSDGKTLHNQKVRLVVRDLTSNEYVTDGSFMILNESGLDVAPTSVDVEGEPVYQNLIYSGDNVYVRFDYNKLLGRGIDHEYVLVAISDLYTKATSYGENISGINKLNIINQDVYASITSEISINKNGEYSLTRDGLSQVGEISKVVLKSDDVELVSVKFDGDTSAWILKNTNGKLGSTKVWVVTPNGYTAFANVVVWQETNFENLNLKFGNRLYDATLDGEEPTTLYFICGSVINVSYMIDGVEYPTSTGGMKLTASEYSVNLLNVSLDCSQVSIGRSGGETLLTFNFVNLHNDDRLYFKFKLEITKPISEFYLDPTAGNDLEVIPTNSTNVPELEVEKSGNFTLIPNPNDATINPEGVSWGISYDNKSFMPTIIEALEEVDGLDDVYQGKIKFILVENKFTVFVNYTVDLINKKIVVDYSATKDASVRNNAFNLFIVYNQTYYNLDGSSYVLNIGNYGVLITIKDIVVSTSITPSENVVTFNKHQLKRDGDNFITGVDGTDKHIYTITYSILPNKGLTYEGIVVLDNNKNPMEYDENKNVYFPYGTGVGTAVYHLALDEKMQSVTITLNYGYDSLSDFNFYIATKDSIKTNGTYRITTKIEVKIAQGTLDSPYEIKDATDLQYMNNDLTGYYKLLNNIYLSDTFTPIGNIDTPFTGTLDGNGKFITGFNGDYNVTNNENSIATYGLFGYISKSVFNQASVKNLTIQNFNIKADYTNYSGNKDVYLGILAGYLGGSVENITIIDSATTNYSKINSDLVYENHKYGITYVGSSINSIHNVFVGGLAGVIASDVNNVVVKSFINFSDEDDEESNTFVGGLAGVLVEGQISNNNSLDIHVNVVIKNTNSHSSEKTFVGGVVGANQGTISNINARVVVLANNNVGGFAGLNIGYIANSVVQPTIAGKQNVGGFAAHNVSGKRGSLSEYVMFDKKSDASYANNHIVCITGDKLTGNFNGNISSSKVIMLDQLDRVSMFNTSIYGENNVGGFVGVNYFSEIDSVMNSAKLANLTNIIANISYSSVKTYFGVTQDSAFANRKELSIDYAKDNIEGLFYGDIVVNGGVAGGLVGYGKDLSSTSNYSHVHITSLSNTSVVGGLAGKVDGYLFVNTTPVLGEVYGEASKVGGFIGDATSVTTINDAYDFFTIEDNILSYKNEIESETLTKGINNSYTLLKHNGEYVPNFVGDGEYYEGILSQEIYILKVDVVNEENGTYTATYYYFENGDWTNKIVTNSTQTESINILGKVSVKVPRIFVSNSFYIGYKTLNNSSTELDFSVANVIKPSYYPTSDDTSYSNLRHFDVKFEKYNDGTLDLESFAWGNADINIAYTKGLTILTPDDVSIKNPIVDSNTEGSDSTTTYYVVESANVDKGLNSAYPTNESYYMNSTVNGGLPVPFAIVKSNGTKPNLVYDISPESISVELKDGYYATNLNEEKIFTLQYDVENPLFVGENKELTMADILTVDDDYNIVLKPNAYCLTDKSENSILGLNIKPEFVKDGKVVFTSSNPNLAQVIVDGTNVYVALKGVGNVNIYISSAYNLSINEVINLQIFEKINSFDLAVKSNDGLSYTTLKGEYQLVRNYTSTIYPTINGSRENLNNVGFELTSDIESSGNLYVNGKDIFGKTIKVDSSLFSLNAKEIFENVTLKVKPYITFVIGGKNYIQYLNEEETLHIKSINGTFEINGPSTLTFPVTNSEEFEVVLTTDSQEEAINLNVAVGEEENTYNIEKIGEAFVVTSTGTNLASILNFSLISTTAGDGVFTYHIRVSLPYSNYSYITNDTTFNVSVELVNNVHNVDPYKFDIIVIPQQVQSVVVNHYTNMVFNEGAVPESGQFETYKYPSSSVIPGYTSLVVVDINPSYAQLDKVVVSLSSATADIEQLVEKESTINGYSTFERYTDYDKDYLTKQIVVKNLVSKYNGVFDGRLYFALHVDSTLSDSTISINFKGFVDGREVDVFDKDLLLNVVSLPNVELKFEDGLSELPVAVGTSVDFTITASNYDTITFNTEDLESIGELSKSGENTYTFTFNDNYDKQHRDLYKYISITASAKRTLAYGVYSKSSTIQIMLVPFVVRGIEIDGAENGKIKAYYNQIKELSATLVTEYSEDYNTWLKSKGIKTIDKQIDALNEQMNYSVQSGSGLSGKINSVYNYYKNSNLVYSNLFKTSATSDGNVTNQLQGRAYNDFVVRMLDDNDKTKTVTSLQFTKLNMQTYILASINIVYTLNGTTSIRFENDGVTDSIVKEFSTSVTGDIISISDDEYPNPITSIEDLRAMEKGENYILLNDLVLINWEPIKAEFETLDGNGYTITIMSFADISSYSTIKSGINIGLFSTIGDSNNSDVTIKNLTVEINPGVVGETEGSLNLSNTLEINATNKNNTAEYTEITFGVIAGENYGTITNTVVTNRATNLRIQRKDILKQQVPLGYVEMENLEDFKKYLDKFDNLIPGSAGYDSSLSNVDVVYVNSGKNTQTQGNTIGGFVGLNMGYITNSNVENVSIKGTDLVGGFVGLNSGHISSSYFKGASIIDTDSNSANSSNIGLGGFVANNSTSGVIQYSYVSGIEGFDNTPNSGLGNIDKNEYVGAKYSDNDDLRFLRAMNSAIYTQTNAGGFAYKNDGLISNSYSNILVSAQSGAGFVLDNDGGKIEYSYTMSSVKYQGTNDIPFTKDGTVTESYYLKVDATDLGATNLDKVDIFSNENENLGTALNATQFADYNSFTSYAFNTDYHENKEITSSVWFIPRDFNYYADKESANAYSQILLQYFRHSSYAQNRPELVSANLKALSLRYYCVEDDDQGSHQGNLDEKGYYYNAVVSYDYYYIVDEKTQTVNAIEYKYNSEKEMHELSIEQGSILNPFLLDDGDGFNNKIVMNSVDGVNTKSYRLLKDITFDNLYQTANTCGIIFSGNLDGNGMTIENLHIESDTQLEVVDSLTSFGMFSKISGKVDDDKILRDTGVVRALNINIEEINGANVNLVGVLAGHLDNAKVYNISVDGSVSVNVQGLNAVGGIAGMATGKTEMINVESNVSVKANLTGNKNLFRKYNYNAKDTTFQVYNGLNLTDENNNIKNVSYAGGVVGIFNVDKNPAVSIGNDGVKNLDRMRTAKTYGEIKLQGQIVGGITGYVGTTSAISNIYVEVENGAHFVASRIAGGIVGHNEGKINRAGIYNANQKTIDDYIARNADSLDNSTSNTSITNNYSDLFGYFDQNSNLNSNAHFIGGIVGLNNGNECSQPETSRGVITNSYSRVDVVSQDALYAGGIIGLNIAGKINSVYATGSVFGALGTGGIIGIQANFDLDGKLDIVTVNNTKDSISTNLISNSKDIYRTTSDDKTIIETQLGMIVGANIWTYAHTNTIRAHYYINANNSYIGMLTGYVMGAGEDSQAGEYYSSAGFSTRKNGEDIFFKQTFVYNNNSQIINEIGNINRGNDLEKNDVVASDLSYSVGVKQNGKFVLISGFSSEGEDRCYKFSRLGDIGSVRSLKEIVNRISSNDGESKFLNRFTGEEVKGTSAADGIITQPRIYYTWDITEWAGTELNENNVKLDSEYVFPGHTNRVEAKVVYVYNEEDLLLMKEYHNAEFILMNDITLTENWKPVGTHTSPFRGILRSNDADDDGVLENYSINGIKIDSTDPNVGFIAISNGAKIRSVKFNFASYKANNIKHSDSSAGMLIGRALGSLRSNLIENVTITSASEVEMQGYEYNGGIIGAGDRVVLTGNKISGITLSDIDAMVDKNYNINLNFGWIAGDITLTNNFVQEIDANNKPVYTEDGNPKLVEQGHVGNKVENCNLDTITINSKNPVEDKTFTASTLYVGGLFGNVISKSATDTFLDSTEYSGKGIKIQVLGNENREKEIEVTNSKGQVVKNIISTQAYCNDVAVGGLFGNVKNLGVRNLKYNISTNYAVEFENGQNSTTLRNGFVAETKDKDEILATTFKFSLGGLMGYANMCDIDKIDALVGKTVKYTNASNLCYEEKNAKGEKTEVIYEDFVQHDYNIGLLIGGFVNSTISESGLAYSCSSKNTNKQLEIEFDGNVVMPNVNFGTIGNANTSEIKYLTAKNFNIYFTCKDSPIAQDTMLNGGGLVGYAYDTNLNYASTLDGDLMFNAFASINNSINLGGIVGYAFGGGDYNLVTSDTDITQLRNNASSVYVGGFVGKIGKYAEKVEDGNLPTVYTYNFVDIETKNYILNENLIETSIINGSKDGIGGLAGGIMYYSSVIVEDSIFNSNIGYTLAMGTSPIAVEVYDVDKKANISTTQLDKIRVSLRPNYASHLNTFFKNTTYKGGVVGYTEIEKKDYVQIGGDGNVYIYNSIYNGDLVPYSTDWGIPVTKEVLGFTTSRGTMSSYKSVIISEGTGGTNYGTVIDSTNMNFTANYGVILYSKIIGSVNNKETGFVYGCQITGNAVDSRTLISGYTDMVQPVMYGSVSESTIRNNKTSSNSTLDGVSTYLNNVILEYEYYGCDYAYIAGQIVFIEKPVEGVYAKDENGLTTVYTDVECTKTYGQKASITDTTITIGENSDTIKQLNIPKYIYYLYAGIDSDNRTYITRTEGTENGLYLEETRLVSSFMNPKTYVSLLDDDGSVITKTTNNAYLTDINFEFNDVWMKVNGKNNNRVGFKWMFKTYKYQKEVDGIIEVDEQKLRDILKNEEGYFNNIDSPEKLIEFSYAVNNLKYTDSAILTKDIDMAGKVIEPIGTFENPFKGGFNGNGHKISNLTVISDYNAGLFGYVEVNGQNFTNVLIENSTFINTKINETVKVSSQLINSLSVKFGEAKIKLSQIGLRYNDMFSVTKGASNEISTSSFVGNTSNPIEIEIENSYAIMYSVDYGTGTKTLKDAIINSWINGTKLNMNSGYVAALDYGILSKAEEYEDTNAQPVLDYFIDDLYLSGDLSNFTNSDHNFTFTNVYGTGGVAKGVSSSYDENDDYKDLIQIQDQALTTEELCGFEWHTVWTRDPNSNYSLPILTHNGLYWKDYALSSIENIRYNSGVVTIYTAEGLAYLSNIVNVNVPTNTAGNIEIAGKYYNPEDIKSATVILANNINLGGKFWTPIGTEINPFKGSFDGNNKVILNLTTLGQYSDDLIYTDGYSGLFGCVSLKANTKQSFKNVTLTNVAINDRKVGGLIAKIETPAMLLGVNSLIVENITIESGFVKGIYSAGGIIGEIEGNTIHKLEKEIGGKIQIFEIDVKTNIQIRYCQNLAEVSEYVQNIGIYDRTNNPAGYKTSQTTYLGGIAGYVGEGVKIFNVINKGKVTSLSDESTTNNMIMQNFAIGGIVGRASGANIDTALMTSCVSVARNNNDSTNTDSATGGIVGVADKGTIIQNVKVIDYIGEKPEIYYGKFNTGGIVGLMDNAFLYEGAVFAKIQGVGSNNIGYFVGKYMNGEVINLYSPHSFANKSYLFGQIADGKALTIKMIVCGETSQQFWTSFDRIHANTADNFFSSSSAWFENEGKWTLNEFGRNYDALVPLSAKNLAVNYMPTTTRLENDVTKQYEVSTEDDLISLNQWYTFRCGYDYLFGIKFTKNVTITSDIVIGTDSKIYKGTKETHALVSAEEGVTITLSSDTRDSGLFGWVSHVDFDGIKIAGKINTSLHNVGGLVNVSIDCKYNNCSSSVVILSSGEGATGGIVGYFAMAEGNGVFTNNSYIGNYDGGELTESMEYSIEGYSNVGGLIGHVSWGIDDSTNIIYNSINISGSSVKDASIQGFANVGGLIGYSPTNNVSNLKHCVSCAIYCNTILSTCPLCGNSTLTAVLNTSVALEIIDDGVEVDNLAIDFWGFTQDSANGWWYSSRFGSIAWGTIAGIWENPSGMYRRDFNDENIFDDENISSAQWYGPTNGASGNVKVKGGFYAPTRNEIGKDSSVYYTTFGCDDGDTPVETFITDEVGMVVNETYTRKFFSTAVGYNNFTGTFSVGLCYGFSPMNSTSATASSSQISSTKKAITKDSAGYIILDRFTHWIYIAIEPESASTYKHGIKVIEYTYKFDETQTAPREYDFIKDVMTTSSKTANVIKIHTAETMLKKSWDNVEQLYTNKDFSTKTEIKGKNKVSDLFCKGGEVNTFIDKVRDL